MCVCVCVCVCSNLFLYYASVYLSSFQNKTHGVFSQNNKSTTNLMYSLKDFIWNTYSLIGQAFLVWDLITL